LGAPGSSSTSCVSTGIEMVVCMTDPLTAASALDLTVSTLNLTQVDAGAEVVRVPSEVSCLVSAQVPLWVVSLGDSKVG
jgi:hypothetical protein